VADSDQTKTHIFYSPNKVIIGLESAALAADEVKRLGSQKAMVVTDPGVIQAELTKPIEASLQAGGIDYVVYDGVKPEPPARVIDSGAEIFRSQGCDLVLGIGGGSSLDVAKGISILAGNGGKILDYAGIDRVPKKGAPMILIPTTAGTGSEVSRGTVITDEAQQTKSVVFSSFALADTAVVDPLLTLSMPPKVTADTGMDALVHAIETYVSMEATVFSDILAERAIELIADFLPMAWSKGSNTEARYQMSLAATLAGMAFASGGLGAVHALAYPLGTEFHLTHGRTNAIMLPHIVAYNLSGNPRKYARIAYLMGQDVEGLPVLEAAAVAPAAIQELLETIHVSCRISDYGIPAEALPKLVAGAMNQSRLFVPNPRELSEEDVKVIYQGAY